MFILDDIFIWWPAKGIKGVFKKVQEAAKNEKNEEDSLRRELLKIRTLLEMDEISKQDYRRREAEIFSKLHELFMQKHQTITHK